MAEPAVRELPGAWEVFRAARALRVAERLHLGIRRGSAPWSRVVGALRPDGGSLLDVGCGPGLLAYLLERAGYAGLYLGVDPDERKVVRARTWLDGRPDRRFVAAGAEAAPGAGFDQAAIVDVLYLVPRQARRALLSAVAERLRPGGRLVVLTSGGGPRWKRLLDRLQEGLATLLGVTRGAVVDPCDGGEVAALLRETGFDEVRVEDVGAGYLHGFELVSARRGRPRAEA